MADSPISWLLVDHLLVCPMCGVRDAITASVSSLQCGACDHEVPMLSGVPDFYTGYATHGDTALTGSVDDAVVSEIAAILDLPEEPEVRSDIAAALQLADRDTDTPALTAEIREVHARFVGGDVEEPPIPTSANRQPRATIERHYAPAGLVAGEKRFVNVRFRNTGSEIWSSRTKPHAITAAARFHRRSFGRRSVTATTYTNLPIDIAPGRAITLPVEIDVPTKADSHQLELGLFHHPNGFVDEANLLLDVEIHADAHPSTRPPSSAIQFRKSFADYGKDHLVANEMVDAALDRLWPAADRRLVEIGGSTHPQSWNHDRTRLVNIDISAPTLQLGALYDRHHNRSIVHMCADAMRPPLAPEAWHAVVMYATLHHFPEPEKLLQAAARLLMPGGFVALMCEPTDTTLAHPAGIRDLLSGINEQTFAVDEYEWMADQAGLTVEQGYDDGGSFKAILTQA